MTEPKKPKRTAKGQFAAGASGNAAGRKPGAPSKHAKLRAELVAHAPALVARVVQQALAGDPACLRLALERCLPALKPSEQAAPVALPGDSLAERGRAILAAVERGELAPGQGAVLMAALAALGRTIETDELLRRIEALEQRAAGGAA
jgi:hypothetical protein